MIRLVERSRGNHDNELEGLNLCHHWIMDCVRSESPEFHSSCRNHRTRSQKALRRPSRLIQLSKEGDDAELSYTIREYIPGQQPSTGSLYVTVSCPDWTDDMAASGELRLENVHSWTSTSLLPGCLRQAAQIAFDAGVQCLWVPKLDPGYTKDPITTAHIFAGGVFNIASMTCAKLSDPLLSSSRELSRMPVVRPQWAPEQKLAIYRNEGFQDSVTGSLLWNSALFYQATLLSPATLYCGKDQLWWQCYHGRGALCSEALAVTGNHCRSSDNQEEILGQLAVHKPSMWGHYKSYANFDSPVSVSEAGSSNDANFLGFESFQKCLAAMWTKTIAAYSMTSIQTTEDRAAVINSIAECVPLLAAPGAAGLFDSLTYAHGCWSADLVEQLAWDVVCDYGEGSRGLPYRNNTTDRFPTWSWLSIPGRVSFAFPISTHPRITTSSMLPDEPFLSPVAKARFSTAEEYSAIGVATSGSARACGSLIPARVQALTAEEYFAALQLEGLGRGHVKWDCRDELDRALKGRGENESDAYRAWPIYAHQYEDRGVLGVRGLLLRRIENGQCQVFVRCGWFQYHGQAEGDKDEPLVLDKTVVFQQGDEAGLEEEFIIV